MSTTKVKGIALHRIIRSLRAEGLQYANKASLVAKIRELYGYEGDNETVLRTHLATLPPGSFKVQPKVRKPHKPGYVKPSTKSLKNRAARFSKENKVKHYTPAVQAVEASLLKYDLNYAMEVPYVKRASKKFPKGLTYIADFVLKNCLIIEVDGGCHTTAAAIAYDKRRDSLLLKHRFYGRSAVKGIIRIPNEVALAPDFDISNYVDVNRWANKPDSP